MNSSWIFRHGRVFCAARESTLNDDTFLSLFNTILYLIFSLFWRFLDKRTMFAMVHFNSVIICIVPWHSRTGIHFSAAWSHFVHNRSRVSEGKNYPHNWKSWSWSYIWRAMNWTKWNTFYDQRNAQWYIHAGFHKIPQTFSRKIQ